MLKKALVAAGILAASMGVAAAQTTGGGTQMSQAQCQSLWNRINTAGGDSVTQTQVSNYVRDFQAVDANSDGRLSSAEFMAACSRGQVQDTAATGTSPGTTGTPGTGTPGSGTR